MIRACRSCDQSDLEVVLSLGCMPLANALVSEEQPNKTEPSYPLDLAYCPNCTLVQIMETVPPEDLFREYLYFSSFSDTVLHHAEKLSDRLIRQRRLNGRSLVMEIASNDGYLLQFYHGKGIPVLGIEPAKNIAKVAQEERGIRTLCEFFDKSLAKALLQQGLQADVVHANNVLAHVADLNGFVEGIGLLLKNDGTAIVEVPYVRELIERTEFDTIYHEHLCYFSLTALVRLFLRHKLVVEHVERVPVHGGSLRLFIHKSAPDPQSPAVRGLLDEETARGMDRIEFYQGFAQRVEDLKRDLYSLLRGLKQEDKKLAAYGAAAKGSILLNYIGIGRETLDFVVDRSIHKQGRYTPFNHLRIFPPEKLMEEKPDYVLLLAWNIADEVLSQQADFRKLGGRFIIPVPEPRIV